jgi:hypothetical protein
VSWLFAPRFLAGPTRMPRFVILRHELPEGQPRASHWDLMFEAGSVLRTWAIDQDLLSVGDQTAEALADHRRAYLDYEGPVSGDRGTVTRWDRGEFAIERDEPRRFVARLAGQKLQGRLTLVSDQAGHSWRVSFTAEPTSG